MTSSLIPERPLLISPTLAATIGLEEAVLLHVVSELLLQHPVVVRNERRFAEISDDALIAALPFWNLADIKRVQRSLAGLGLLLVDAVPGNDAAAYLAINQPHKTNGNGKTRASSRSAAAPANSGTATPITNHWQPDATVYQQCAQRNIPQDFIARELPDFIMYHRDRGKSQYSWNHTFFKWLVGKWEKQRSAQGARVLETTMGPDWQPSDDAVSILEHGGISLGYIEEAVPEFVLYWREKGTLGSEWNSRFIAHVRRQWERYTHALEHDNTPRSIPRDFKPDPACYDVLAMANIDPDFAEAQVKEFVLYWQDRNEIHRSWNTKFLQHVKYKWAQQSQVGKSLLERITDRSWAD
ncbi:MAG TPA: DnaT-like ssDNA-binding domain-containing protein [Candidatus Acidoferrum sp.]|nr:DnaT-like ssDNA-binding domain-containing protein [Candidatus Acidoferrum sp.]